jgi:hypothetical protein
VRNDAAGWAELVARLRGIAIAAIGLEASGGYERGAMRASLAAGLPARQVNPFKLRQFAKASGILAKSDRLDARVIASFIAIMPTRPARLRPPAIERLAGMLAVRTGNWNPVLRAFRKRLKDAGKDDGKMAKVVIVAVMRKMITILNAMVRDDVV